MTLQIGPGMVYTFTLKELQKVVDTYGASMFYNGVLYDIMSKRICPGRYKVWLEAKKD
jgi:hypothetical protein